MKIKYIFPLLLVLFTFACKNELTIFEQINQETKLEEAKIKGSVNSIVNFKDKLYTSDGNIYSKDIDVVRGWSKISSPGGSVIKLAADQNNLYALNSEKKLYYTTDGSTWNPVDVSGTISSIDTIFDNGLDTAYIRGTAQNASAKSYFKLDGTTVSTTKEVSSIVVLKTDKGTYTTKDETITGPDGSKVEKLGSIFSLTYSVVDKAVYAGTNSGLRKLPVDDTGKLTGENQNPPGNHSATIKSYEAFVVMATGTTAADSALYTSTIARRSANAKINGLWGYYYNRRDKWNRE